MTTAFIAEVDTKEGTRYVGPKGKLCKIPFFFASSTRLKRILELGAGRYRNSVDYYVPARERDVTRVCVVTEVEKGLRASTGANMPVVEFLVKQFGSSGKYAAPKPVNAVFKIALEKSSTNRKMYAGAGKFGRTWERQGDLRLHISNNITRLFLRGYYIGARVMMIELDPANGVTPLKISYTPIVDFYNESPSCRKRWTDLTQTSLSNFNGDPAKLSPYA